MSAFPEAWDRIEVPFTEEHPLWLRDGPHPSAPVVVLCHGMGQTPGDWLGAAPRILSLPVHLLLPAGPYPHEVRSGSDFRVGHAWYLYDGGPERFRRTVDRSEAWLAGVLGKVESDRGWAPARRVLVGYSQGAYFAFIAALRRPEVFSHLIAVAGRLKAEFVEAELRRKGTLQTLIVHGERDQAVLPTAAESSRHALELAGFPVELLRMPSGHAFTPEIDAACAAWITRRACGE